LVKVVTKIFRSIGAFIKLSPKGGRPHLLMVALLASTFGSVALTAQSTDSWADSTPAPSSFIIQDGIGVGSSPAANLVDAVGGQVQRTLDPISAVSASLTPSEVAGVETVPGVVVTPGPRVTGVPG
jgi:hypothetical protein